MCSLAAAVPQNKECLGTEGVSHLCGPVGRGGSLLAAGLRTGRLVLLDCRTPRSLKVRPEVLQLPALQYYSG
eukprot:1159731-Pelagomonas_calceolata.AAC.2